MKSQVSAGLKVTQYFDGLKPVPIEVDVQITRANSSLERPEDISTLGPALR
jgi:hypothetical protein